MESLSPGFVETDRMDWLRAEVVKLAPELDIDQEPDYFIGKPLTERYRHLAYELDQLTRQVQMRRDHARDAYETPKFLIGHIQEQDLSWPISVTFAAGASRQWPNYLSATWRIQQFDAPSRHLHQLRQSAHYDDEADNGSNLRIESAQILRSHVYLNKIRSGKMKPEEMAHAADEMNFIARSVEAYGRLAKDWPEETSRKPRQIKRDVISQTISELFSEFPDEDVDPKVWPEF